MEHLMKVFSKVKLSLSDDASTSSSTGVKTSAPPEDPPPPLPPGQHKQQQQPPHMQQQQKQQQQPPHMQQQHQHQQQRKPLPPPALLKQSVVPDPKFINADKYARISMMFADVVRKYTLPGMAGVVVSAGNGNVYFSAGVKRAGGGEMLRTDDLFHLGSCAKAMTATVVAIFVEKGMLNWDSTLPELLPEYAPIMNPAFRGVKLSMLTANRSGITGDCLNFAEGTLWKALWNQRGRVVDGRKLVCQEILSRPPASPPGSKYEYSNFNYMITGAILEKVSGGHPWESIIRAELFEPLGMRSCGFGAPACFVPHAPSGHRTEKSGDGRKVYKVVPAGFSADNPPSTGPAGTVYATLEDWGKFIQFHMDGFNGRPTILLKPQSFKILHEQYPDQQYTSGGWFRIFQSGGPTLSHSGSNTMNFATVCALPEKNIAFMVVSNVGIDAQQPVDELMTALKENFL